MTFSITVLGSGSAIPTPYRQSSAHVANIHEHFYLIDCAEATQIALQKYGYSIHKIDNIFISHLHGDHYFGLPGLLHTLHLQGRKKTLNLFAHSALNNILNVIFSISGTQLSYELNLTYLDGIEVIKLIHADKYVQVFAFPLIHRIPTWGFLFVEQKRTRKIRKDFLKDHQIPPEKFSDLLEGKDYVDSEGRLFRNEDITIQLPIPRSYAYCSDTIYNPILSDYISNVTLLYHESSFLDQDSNLAKQKYHSTAKEAALIAKMVNAKQLLLGHISTRYPDQKTILEEACLFFENTLIAHDGLTIYLK